MWGEEQVELLNCHHTPLEISMGISPGVSLTY